MRIRCVYCSQKKPSRLSDEERFYVRENVCGVCAQDGEMNDESLP
jgi:hypothetical protein